MSLTGNDIAAALRAAGASTSGLVAPTDKIADLFNDAMAATDAVCAMFNDKYDVAALVSECMMESAYFRTTVEYSNTGPYQPYRGRTFIQLTWDTNYRGFGNWCKKLGLISDGNYFVNNPTKLGELQWAALGGVYYFTQVMFHGKPLTDYSHNIDQVGKAVNLGDPYSSATPNGQAARRAAYQAVLSSTGDIVPDCNGSPDSQTTGGDELAMAEHITTSRTKKQRFDKINNDEWLRLNDAGDVSLIVQPGKLIGGIIDIHVSGIKAPDYLQVYPIACDVDRDGGSNAWKETSSDKHHPIKIPGLAEGGWVRDRIPFDWVLGDQDKGWDYRALRFMVSTTTKDATIEKCLVSGWFVKN